LHQSYQFDIRPVTLDQSWIWTHFCATSFILLINKQQKSKREYFDNKYFDKTP